MNLLRFITRDQHTTPWSVHRIGDMVSPDVFTQVGESRWVRSVPARYHSNLRERIVAAWWVMLGRADAVIWPSAGDLEDALIPFSERQP